MAGNLTRDEARERARLLHVGSYRVEADVTKGDEVFRSTTVIKFGCREPGADSFVDLHNAGVRQVTLNGTPLAPSSYDEGRGRIPLPDLVAENELTVVADCAYSRAGVGLHRFVDPVDDGVYLYTQFQTADAHRVYACFDQPDLKATFALKVIAPKEWQVVSNTTTTGRDGVWTFPATERIPTYVTALVAGPYHVVRDCHEGLGGTIPLGVFCRTSVAEHLDAEAVIEVTRQGLEYFERAFDWPYPFGKYDQVFVPEFNAGAMENAGCVTFHEYQIFRSRVTDASYQERTAGILHELAHMWFGDLVTLRWWDDLWLNESLATYLSVLCQAEATKWTGAWTAFASAEKDWAYRQDQLPSTHPVCADIPDIHAVEVNFDGITYAKGASVLKQLSAHVGRDQFFDGVRRYVQRHAWGNTVLADLLVALEQASGRDLAAWSKDWLETSSVNTLRPSYEVNGEGDITSFAVLQEAPADHPTLRSHRIAIGLYDKTPDGIVRRDRVELDVSDSRTEVTDLVGKKRPDLVLVNDDDLTYANIRFDEHSLTTLVNDIGDIRDPLPRTLCLAAAWDMCRNAELGARQYLELLLSGIAGLADVMVTQVLLRQAIQALQQYAHPAWRDTGRELLAQRLRELMVAAGPGSDLQLGYVQGFACIAGSAGDRAFIKCLLDGTMALEGLIVDTDLRWTLLHRLVVHGMVDGTGIEDELRRDPTSAGACSAATAFAAIPTADAKIAAWASITSGDLSNAVFRATLDGFAQPDQSELLVPYAERYFEEVGRIWSQWSGTMAHGFAQGAYPFLVIDQETIDRTDEYLATQHPPPALVRMLREGRDSVARALRCQSRDNAG